jgi:protein-tyrosine-phosphatase
VLPPEGRKRQVEDRDLILAMDEERAARVIHLVPCGEVDVAQRFGELRETSGVNVDPGAPQDTAEDQQVVEET